MTGSIALQGLEEQKVFGAKPVFTASPFNDFLTDLDGSVQVNLDVEQFKEIAKNSALDSTSDSFAEVDVVNTKNIFVTQIDDDIDDGPFSPSSPEIQTPVPDYTLASVQDIDFQPLVTPFMGNVDVRTKSRIYSLNATDIQSLKDLGAQGLQLADFNGTYRLNAGRTNLFSAEEVLAIPSQGIASYRNNKIALSDSPEEITELLPHLSQRQLMSIDCIQFLLEDDASELTLSASDFAIIDSTPGYKSVYSSSQHVGIRELVNAEDEKLTITVQDELAVLISTGILTDSGVAQSISSSSDRDTVNLLQDVASVFIKSEAGSSTVDLSGQTLTNYLIHPRVSAAVGTSFVLEDTAVNIRNFFLNAASNDIDVTSVSSVDYVSEAQVVDLNVEQATLLLESDLNIQNIQNLRFTLTDNTADIEGFINYIANVNKNSDSSLHINLSQLVGVTSLDYNGTLQLDYEDYQALTGTTINLNDLTNIQLVVNGTAAEIESLLSQQAGNTRE